MPGIPNQEVMMSLLSHTHERTDLKHRDYGFILGLVCMALALVVASAGITSEITSVGP